MAAPKPTLNFPESSETESRPLQFRSRWAANHLVNLSEVRSISGPVDNLIYDVHSEEICCEWVRLDAILNTGKSCIYKTSESNQHDAWALPIEQALLTGQWPFNTYLGHMGDMGEFCLNLLATLALSSFNNLFKLFLCSKVSLFNRP